MVGQVVAGRVAVVAGRVAVVAGRVAASRVAVVAGRVVADAERTMMNESYVDPEPIHNCLNTIRGVVIALD